jgi:hypothetical protein
LALVQRAPGAPSAIRPAKPVDNRNNVEEIVTFANSLALWLPRSMFRTSRRARRTSRVVTNAADGRTAMCCLFFCSRAFCGTEQRAGSKRDGQSFLPWAVLLAHDRARDTIHSGLVWPGISVVRVRWVGSMASIASRQTGSITPIEWAPAKRRPVARHNSSSQPHSSRFIGQGPTAPRASGHCGWWRRRCRLARSADFCHGKWCSDNSGRRQSWCQAGTAGGSVGHFLGDRWDRGFGSHATARSWSSSMSWTFGCQPL